ncbi:MAG: myo-inositol 2-dehydrogenase [Lentisphaerae bacterium GWF2_50_93]|nr:MAG: myo-inositol 2-dehydrogenase [Lentisphaerae bacterium GWF2_50_93]
MKSQPGKTWLVGAGPMAKDYAKVLLSMKKDFTVIGRGETSADEFSRATGVPVVAGGITSFLTAKPGIPSCAIVSVGVEQLYQTTLELLAYGVKSILVEKPASLEMSEFTALAEKSRLLDAGIFIAYNRRFYSSVQAAMKIISEDGGLRSFTFEFTEWSHRIAPLKKAPGVKEKWFLANSTHVTDLAFYIGGFPRKIECFTDGDLPWHPSGSIFTGAGRTDKGAPFSYFADWAAPGRWGVEFLTAKRRLILRPLEELHIQELGSVAIQKAELDDRLDREFKPGLFRQVEAFLDKNTQCLPDIHYQAKMMPVYFGMANYR